MATGLNGYCIFGSTASCSVDKVSGGSVSFLFSCGANYIVGDTVKLQMVGTTLTVFINGVTENNSTDASFASGVTGVEIQNGNAAGKNFIGSFSADCIPTCGGGGGAGLGGKGGIGGVSGVGN